MSDNHQSLAGRTAVITGASSGIGEATARALAAAGAKVALLARRKDRLDALAATIRQAGGTADAYEIDVTDRAAVDRIAAAIGRVDIVINNAGVMLPNPIDGGRADQWKQQVDLNIGGLLNVIGAFTPALVEAGKRGPADLVNVSSIAGRNIFPYFAVYSGTKAFVSHLSVTLRAELGPKGVRVSAIEPGIVGTELQDHVDFQGAKDWIAGARAQIEFLEPDDIAQTIAFTVSAPKRVNLQQVTIMPTTQPS
jgi:NADP-dependent 3-hydroxy acid dehydrogenase YdfG